MLHRLFRPKASSLNQHRAAAANSPTQPPAGTLAPSRDPSARRRQRPQQARKQRVLALSMSIAMPGAYLLMTTYGDAFSEQATPLQAAAIASSWIPELAQAPTSVLVSQGNQVLINGQRLPAAWSLRQRRLGLSDLDLAQGLGFNLLSSRNVQQQPVQWFTEPAQQPLVLGTWLTPQYRYLDITDLARSLGWGVRAEGSTLQITTPAAQVLGLRQGRQSWGDRLVLDLSYPAPWRVSEEADSFTVTVDAGMDAAAAQALAATVGRVPGNLISSVSLSSSATQTQLRVTLSARTRPRITTLPAPYRLVIDVGLGAMGDRDILWAPGVRWRQQFVTLGSARFPVIALELDPRQPGLSLQPILPEAAGVVGTAPLVKTAQRTQAAAAINGGFFNRNNQLPLGAIRVGDRWLSGPILGRGAIAWTGSGEVLMGRLRLQESVTTAAGNVPIFSLNSGLVGAGLGRYTADWGASYSPILDNETVITVQGDRVTAQQPAGAAGQGRFPIPTNGYLLVARGSPSLPAALPIGITVQLNTATVPAEFSRFPNIIGGGPLLIQNQQIVLNAAAEGFSEAFIREAAPRSAIARRADGMLMLVAVHQRQGGPGPTLAEFAQIMQQLGAVDALNLDGGSSTSLYLGGQLINRAPRTAARVHNGIGVFLQPTAPAVRP